MKCRSGCGACCIAPSLSSPIPGMPQGKRAGERCVQLTAGNRCALFNSSDRPKVCVSLKADGEMCGETTEHALEYLQKLEVLTSNSPNAAT